MISICNVRNFVKHMSLSSFYFASLDAQPVTVMWPVYDLVYVIHECAIDSSIIIVISF